jgi:hypothetical protein
MNTALTDRPTTALDPRIVQEVLLGGDLAKLSPDQRISFYNRLCSTLGLNPLTQPFAYLRLSGKEVLYAKKDCTDQLRFIHGISIDIRAREVIEGIYVVTAGASMPNGRRDESTGAVSIDGLKGESRANAMLKAETKAKRRATLSICGLGMLDETEVESIPNAAPIVEAPSRVALPPGTVQILRVAPQRKGEIEWAEVTYVTDAGEEQMITTHASPSGAATKLVEQLAQEGGPVVLTTKVTPRSKKTVIDTIRRYVAPEITENNAIDAEIAKADADGPF